MVSVTVISGKVIEVPVETSTSFADLKQMIQDKEGIYAFQQHFIAGVKEIENDMQLVLAAGDEFTVYPTGLRTWM